MATFHHFEDIKAWQKARILTRRIYAITKRGAFAKDFGLRDQIRRASVSIMSNIAEGFERNGNREFIHFLSVAKASAGEVRSQLYVALDEGYLTNKHFDELQDAAKEVSKLVGGLMKHLSKSDFRGPKYR